ncbi:MAG: flagellar assembly protein FliW [Deltaproteobacteria bacterium]|nr:flagellar assembly protein FliW [Deltaproteobacteria bacterium]MCX7952877.1 flagellar assembly protein FliW [Deltaproteobacteria bacterium]
MAKKLSDPNESSRTGKETEISKSGALLLIRSTRFGDLEIDAAKVIQVPSGLVGYGRPQLFVLFEYSQPFHWLQSVDDPSLAFVVIDGLELARKFELQAPYGDPDTDLQPEDEYAVILIVTLREPIDQSTVNLLAPIFVNMRNRRAVQVVYDDAREKVRYPLFGELLKMKPEHGQKQTQTKNK